MAITINLPTAYESHGIGAAFQYEKNRQLTLIAKAIIETDITPLIKKAAHTETHITMIAYKEELFVTFSELLEEILCGKYYFNKGFKFTYNNYEKIIHRDDVLEKIEEILKAAGYYYTKTYEYSKGYCKDFDFEISW